MLLAAAALAFMGLSKGPTLEQIVDQARTKPITPVAADTTADYARIKAGFDFETKHKDTVERVLALVALPTTYACKDIVPVVIHTGQLVNSYDQRMQFTGKWVNEILTPPTDENAFYVKNCTRAYDLGELHLGMSSAITPESLGWDPKQRVAFSQQAFALVFYTFAWEPIETMLATHEIKPDDPGIGDWVYLWTVVGRCMGVERELLPSDPKQAQTIIGLLRRKQYYTGSDRDSKDISTLLRNHVIYVCHMIDPDKTVDEREKEKARNLLASFISTSPGLSDALGLGRDVAAGLKKITADGPAGA